jgi:hypothetical protein
MIENLISRLQWESLEQRRAKARATFMYKIVNNLVDVHAEHILTPKSKSYTYSEKRNECIYLWDSTGRVMDPNPVWNWSMVLT